MSENHEFHNQKLLHTGIHIHIYFIDISVEDLRLVLLITLTLNSNENYVPYSDENISNKTLH